jgi:hypothetical protein
MATPRWRKSSYSNGNGGDCVELALLDWRKSSYSDGNGGDCVELSATPLVTAVRDSKNPDGGVLVFPATAFSTFLTSIKSS